jgi:hypothetical protein
MQQKQLLIANLIVQISMALSILFIQICDFK